MSWSCYAVGPNMGEIQRTKRGIGHNKVLDAAFEEACTRVDAVVEGTWDKDNLRHAMLHSSLHWRWLEMAGIDRGRDSFAEEVCVAADDSNFEYVPTEDRDLYFYITREFLKTCERFGLGIRVSY